MKRFPTPSRRSQRGYMVLLVLIALVAMMISGIALVRSMDTNQLVAGNLAARNSTIHSADLAVQQAVNWIQANSTNGALNNDAAANGYYAEEQEPDWTQVAYWGTCTTCTSADNTGNQVSWVIHRMCSIAGSPNAANQFCSSLNGAANNSGSSSSDSFDFIGSPKNFYRITIQVVGPRNTTTLSQAFVTL